MGYRPFWLAVILFWTIVVAQCVEACTTVPGDDPIVINCRGCK